MRALQGACVLVLIARIQAGLRPASARALDHMLGELESAIGLMPSLRPAGEGAARPAAHLQDESNNV